MDENIANFVAIAGTTADVAARYLELSEQNLEGALQLYFDNPNLDVGGSEPTGSNQPSSRPANSQPSGTGDREVITIDSDDDESPVVRSTEDDEAMARRLQEEMYGAGGQPEIRAPDARTTETLLGPGSADWEGGYSYPDPAQRARRQANRPGIFSQRYDASSAWNNDADPEAHRRELSRATGGASETSEKANRLAEMFRPPFDIMSSLSWDEAREEGKEEEKWILVNVQDESIFACQVLNRDIWKDAAIKETVKENFLFLQYNRTGTEGQKYIQYYLQAADSDSAYPHIAIIDPRTGEQVKVWSGEAPKAGEFLMQLHEFLDRYSLNVNARNPVAQRKAEPKPVDVGRMTEEQMLEMALQNSLANGSGPRDSDPDLLTRQDEATGAAGKGKERARDTPMPDAAEEQETPSNPAFDSISSSAPHTEPAADPKTTTRIQFRHSGGRAIRRFALSDPVRRLYEWLKAEPLEGKGGQPFELSSMGKNLIDQLDESIEQAGLKNSTIMVEFQSE